MNLMMSQNEPDEPHQPIEEEAFGVMEFCDDSG